MLIPLRSRVTVTGPFLAAWLMSEYGLAAAEAARTAPPDAAMARARALRNGERGPVMLNLTFVSYRATAGLISVERKVPETGQI
jgi:hypothetical protein